MTAGTWPVPAIEPALEGHVRAALHRLCPRFTPTAPATRTETSLLLSGTLGDQPVIAKHPIDRRPFWLDRCRHEITVYTALSAEASLPIPVPRLIAADPTELLLVVTQLPGTPLGADRYPVTPLPTWRLHQLLDTLDALHRWTPPTGFPTDDDYPTQLAHLIPDVIAPIDRRRFTELHHAITPYIAHRAEHGDPHPANTLATPTGLSLLDFEVTATRPPGYDLAMLWVLLGPDPHTRRILTTRIEPEPAAHAAFWLAATLILAREITSHRRNAPTPRHHARVPRLLADLTTAIAAVRDLHTRLT